MNKFKVMLGIVSGLVTMFNLFFVGGILYGTYNPTSPVLMSIFLVILSIVTGALSAQCLYRYIECDYV